MIFIDAGVFIASYLKGDQHYRKAVDAWQRLANERTPCITTNFVLNETINYFSRRVSPLFAADVAKALYASKTLRIVRPTAAHEVGAIELLRKYADQKVGFTDCISFALMHDMKIFRAFSFDRHFDLPGFIRYPL
ncbi:MAG TPA: PIN domain-containing protein [Thermoanaerobaculia bacterium]